MVTTKRKYKGKTYVSHLLRRSYREDGKVKNETLSNLSHLPEPLIDLIRRSLKGEKFVSVVQALEITSSRAHGHIQAIKKAMDQLNMAELIGEENPKAANLVLAMIAARIAEPATKLATTRHWHTTTLAEDFGVSDAKADDLYRAMDWLLTRQEKMEKKLARRHLQKESIVLYDVSSSYLEGTKCPLAKIGYNRDGKKGLLQVNYGLLTDKRGCPIAVSVHEGNVSDSTTFLPEVRRLHEKFGVEEMIIVGDRGMIGKKAIAELQEMKGIGWISALKNPSIRSLVENKHLQMELFDERNLIEFTSPDYPGERLIACRNPYLALERKEKREALLLSTQAALQTIQKRVEAKRLVGQDQIALSVGKVINKYKVSKHFEIHITKDNFVFHRKEESIQAEAALDGIYIIRTSVDIAHMEAKECVRNYKALAEVERAFRSLKTLDLKVRPIHHCMANRVRAHILLCMLAYYVEWHMKEAWRELLFADPDLDAKAQRDPVAKAKRSQRALGRLRTKRSEENMPLHSFSTLLTELSSIVLNCCRLRHSDPQSQTFPVITTADALQRRALSLINNIQP